MFLNIVYRNLKLFLVITPLFLANWANAEELELSLSGIIQRYLHDSPKMEIYRQSVVESLGTYEQLLGAYDPTLKIALKWRPTYQLGSGTGRLLNRLVPAASVGQLTKTGLSWEAGAFTSFQLHELDYERTPHPDDASRYVQGAFGSVSLPLFRSLNPAVAAGETLAAEEEVRAARIDAREFSKEDIRALVVAYWNLAAAQSRVELAAMSEHRSRALVEEVRALVAANEKPLSDLSLFEASATEAQALKVAEEINLARQHVLVQELLGLPKHSRIAVSQDLPRVTEAGVPNAALQRRLLERAKKAERITALALRESAARSRVQQAENEVRPEIQLSGEAEFSRQSDLFFQNERQAFQGKHLAGIVTLSYAWPVGKHSANGKLAQRTAAFRQSALQRRLFESTIEPRLNGLIRQLGLAAERFHQRNRVISLYSRALEDEKERFRLGMATTIDVIQVEERYLNALLNQVNDRLHHAVILADLAFELDAIDLGSLKTGDPASLNPFLRAPNGGGTLGQ